MSSYLPSRDNYDDIYRRRACPTILDKIAAQVVHDSTITKLNCTGFLGPGDREYYRDLLYVSRFARPAIFLELGCGTSLLGPWLAEQLGLDFVGLDFSSVAISLASAATSQRSTIQKKFVVASFDSTGLPDNSVAVVFSLDALYLATDPVVALREARRVMHPGAQCLFTYFVDSETEHAWHDLVLSADLDIISTLDVTSTWRQHMRNKHGRRWKHRRRIVKELGNRAAAELSVSASMLGLDGHGSYIESTYRYLLHATKPIIHGAEKTRVARVGL